MPFSTSTIDAMTSLQAVIIVIILPLSSYYNLTHCYQLVNILPAYKLCVPYPCILPTFVSIFKQIMLYTSFVYVQLIHILYFDTYTIWLITMSSTWINSVDVVAWHAYIIYGSPLNHVLYAKPWCEPILSYCLMNHIKAKQLLSHKPKCICAWKHVSLYMYLFV